MLKVLNALNLFAAFLVLIGIGLVVMANFEVLDEKVKARACELDLIGCDTPNLRPAQ
jgi:hypothetical protein